MGFFTKDECKEKLLKYCKITKENGKYKGNKSTGYLCSVIPHLKESIYCNTSFLPDYVKDKERYYCILNDISNIDQVPKCFCGKVGRCRTIEDGYLNSCCKDHEKIRMKIFLEDFFSNFKEDFSTIVDKESLILYYRSMIIRGGNYKRPSVIHKDLLYFNSLLYWTMNLVPLDRRNILYRKDIEKRIYILFNDLKELPKCSAPDCDKYVKFLTLALGFSKHCCPRCADGDRQIQVEKTMMEKYEVRSALSLPESHIKGKITKLKKYGDENFNNRPKAANTLLETTGYDNSFKDPKIIEKCENIRLSKTGYKYPMQDPIVLENFSKRMFEKYGYYWGIKKPGTYEKAVETYFEKTGYKNSFQNPECREKAKITKAANGISGYSKVSQELFWSIYNQLSDNVREHTYFATLNKEFARYDKENKTTYFYDFVVSNLKFIIEFDGSYWHSSDRVKKRDAQKQQFIENLGFKMIRVDENTYYADKQKVVQSCIDEIKKSQI